MDRNKYLHVLNDYAFPSGNNWIGERFIFQQDNAQCHKAKFLTQFLNEIGVRNRNWASQSPDKNIIKKMPMSLSEAKVKFRSGHNTRA